MIAYRSLIIISGISKTPLAVILKGGSRTTRQEKDVTMIENETGDQTIAPVDNRKELIAQQLSQLSVNPMSTDIEINLDNAVKVPFGQITALGTAFASVPEFFRTATTQVGGQGGEMLFRCIMPSGATGLKGAGDGLSYGFATMSEGGSKLAKFAPASGATATSVIPYDPTAAMMGLALAQINAKLDTIQETQQEMFDYLRQSEKAEQRANLSTLAGILNDYKFNWDNEKYKTNQHAKVLDIKQSAEKSIVHLRAQISSKSQKKKLLDNRAAVSKRTDEVVDLLEEYRLAVFLYSFASFLEAMLLENFDADYLASFARAIDKRALDYRELYTDTYNAIEQSAGSSLDATLLKGVSFVGKGLGKAIQGTRIGDATPIDEALLNAGENVGDFNSETTSKVAQKLIAAKEPGVAPFAESIRTVNRLYNEPTQLLADSENLYLLPLE